MQTDVVVVGAGAAGLLAAVAARRLGHDVLVVERSGAVGGSTATTDGALWLPANDLMGRAGLPSDTPAEALGYLDALATPVSAVIAGRRAAFTRTAGVVARWLVTSRIALEVVKSLPDCRPEVEGAKAQGRTVRVRSVPRKLDDDWAGKVRGDDGGRTNQGFWGRLANPFTNPGQLSGGAALVCELLLRAVGSEVEFWLDCPLNELIVEGGVVTGVRVTHVGEQVDVRASKGVILACGGFEADQTLREQHLPLPTEASWSVGIGADGTALAAGAQVDAATTGLAQAWWTPVLLSEGRAHQVDAARVAPHSLIVDQAGDRYLNEAQPSTSAGRRMYEHNRGMRSVPSFLIMDDRHRKAYPLGPWAAGTSPKAAIESGELVRATNLDDLAQALSIDRAGLIGSVVAFNQLAKRGKDTDFGRGDSAWDKHFGDPRLRRNPCLASVDRQPFWAVRLYPGDSGTKGGLVIDDRSRVLRGDGEPVTGLWAVSASAASVFGSAQPAQGAGLAAAVVEAYRAVLDLSGQLDELDAALKAD
ncbi:FAD-dependent oxidoreductase [Micropruina glycogenica]|uniref:Putative 3-oxosteroid 1-dehydrogenase n=1 Tax=Micropruina glycogenica TaxID=75385 RepID=A0A2N9JHD1_9ACTN|nr:FAD-dependent oxidoreductase [Micropruina glycogenica]SPD87494.1 putative 3-oxosteroid 1-dehydrogenase [Micropruina glycogenica]